MPTISMFYGILVVTIQQLRCGPNRIAIEGVA